MDYFFTGNIAIGEKKRGLEEQVGTGKPGSEGLVAAKCRGDKAEKKPKILTKPKGSGVAPAFKKNR